MNDKWLWSGKPWRAFKTFALFFSFGMNLILLIILLAAAPLIIPIVADIAAPIVGGLNSSFVDMSEASIQRTINVDDTLEINFDLPLQTSTSVILVDEVPLEGLPAQFVFPDGGGSINGKVFLSLPQGQELPVDLDLVVPVRQTIPVKLDVAVDIPLHETELGGPFNRLQSLFAPLDAFLSRLPATNEEFFDRVLARGDAAGAENEAVTER